MNSSPLRGALAAALLACSASAVLAQAASAPASAPAPAAAPVATPPAPTPAAADAKATETGKLAWYGNKFAGRKTASGEAFNPGALTMAHKTLPFGTRVQVTNLNNKKSVVVRVNDRGPTQADRIGDVSHAAARKLGMLKVGVIDAELAVVRAAPGKKP